MRRLATFLVALAFSAAAFGTCAAYADSVGPAVSGISPASGTTVSTGFTLTFSANDADGINGLAAARVVIDGVTYVPSSVEQGYWVDDPWEPWWVDDGTMADYVFNIPVLPDQGLRSVEIRMTDARGNLSLTYTTIIKSASIIYALQRPLAGGRYNAASGIEVIANGTVEPSTVSVTVDGAPVTCTYESYGAALGRIYTSAAVTAAGTHTIVVSAGDHIGGTPTPAQWTFTVAPTPAGPTIGTPSPGDGAAVQGAFPVTVHVEDPRNVNGSGARLVVDGVAYTPTAAVYPSWEEWIDDENYEIRYDMRYCDLTFQIPDLAPGTHRATLHVANYNGATPITSMRNWTIVRGAQIGFSDRTPAPDSRQQAATSVGVTLTGPIDVGSIVMTVDGSPVAPLVQTAGSTTLVSYPALLSEGSHSVALRVDDLVGSPSAVDSWSFVVDATAPTAPVLTSANGETCRDALAGISATIVDADRVDASTVRLYLDGAELTPVTVGSSSATLTASWAGTLAEGPHTARVEAADLAGNVLDREWSFTVADPPRFGTVAPVPTSIIGGAVTFTLPVTEANRPIDTSSLSAELDGVGVPASYTASDSRHGTLTVPLAGLSNGSHSLAVRIADDAGNLGTKSWTFAADVLGPALGTSSRQPAQGQVLASHALPNMCAVFTDASGVDPSRTEAWLDGATFNVGSAFGVIYDPWDDEYYWDDPTTLVLSSAPLLHDGEHTFRVKVFDVLGNSTTTEWSFTVAEYPSITQVRPTKPTRTLDTTIPVSAAVSDFDGVVPGSVRVDWREANAGRTPGAWNGLTGAYDSGTGAIDGTFTAPNTETRYEIRFTASDASGHESMATTELYVGVVKPTMTTGTGCTSCHQTIMSAHPMSDCDACHAGQPSGPCEGCHYHRGAFSGVHSTSYLLGGEFADHPGDEYPNYFNGRTCADCHSHSDDIEAQRHATTSSGCTCHEHSLTTEHAGRVINGHAFTCQTCHESTDSKVVSALASGDTACSGCHDDVSEGHPYSPAQHTATMGSGDFTILGTDFGTRPCSECHPSTDLSTNHVSTGEGCATCHPTAADAASPWDDTCASSGCHAAGTTKPIHAEIDSAHVIGASSCTAADCHAGGANVAAVHSQATTTVAGVELSSCEICHAPGRTPTTNCTTCHATSPHTAVHDAGVTGGTITFFDASAQHSLSEDCPPIDVNVGCSMCHGEMNLLSLHNNACALCHAGTSPPADSFGTWDGGCSQGACHVTYHDTASSGHDGVYVDDISSGEYRCICHLYVDYTDDSPIDATEAWCGSCHSSRDTSPPNTTVSALPSYVGTASVTFTATDDRDVAATYYVLDGAAPVPASGALLVPASGTHPVSHTLEYWSVDGSGNEEIPHGSVTFVVTPDTHAPTTTSDAGETYWGDAAIHLSAHDDATVFGVRTTYYRFDSGPMRSGLVATLPYAPGEVHTVHFWSVDYAGNVESPKSASFTYAALDTTAPTTTSSFEPVSGAVYSSGRPVTLSAADDSGGSGVGATYYRIDSAGYTAGSSFTVTGDGVHTFSYYSVDRAGNTETAHDSNSFRIDTVAPVTACSATAGTYTGDQTFALTATDTNGSGVASTRWQLDSTAGPWTTGTIVSVPAPSSGTVSHTVYWYSTDVAGNTETTKSVTVQVAAGGVTNGGVVAATGAPVLFTVPAGVTRLTIDLYGAMGSPTTGGPPGGRGGYLRAAIDVTPGQVLTLKVGKAASGSTGGWGGGLGGNGKGGSRGGGGSTSIADGTGVIAEAGGGGGAGTTGGGGAGGTYTTSSSGGNQSGGTYSGTLARAGGGGGWTGGTYGTGATGGGGGGTSHVLGNAYITFAAAGNTTSADGWARISW